MRPAAVIFDLDGVIMDSEVLWNEAKRAVVQEWGGRWRDDAPRTMMGMSAPEWSRYMREELAVDREPADIDRAVVEKMERLYRRRLPVLPGAVATVRAHEARWPLGLASSSNRPIIDLALEVAGLSDAFAVTVSSEEVARGKPAPDVYLEAARRLGVEAGECVAIEDSANGIRAGVAAGMTVVAVPNPHYPPDADVLSLARRCVEAIADATPELIDSL